MKTSIKSLILLLLAAIFILPGNAALQAVGPVSAQNGYPIWYQDTNGTALDLCLAGQDGLADQNCILPAAGEETNFDPALPIVFPGNFPSESFYGYADSLMNIRGGKALLVLGLEAAFATGDPAPDQQIVFGRVRIRIDAPVAGTYKVTHPYGVETFNVIAPGKRAISFTEDIGMVPFSNALTSRHGPFLTAVNPAPPAGYIGNPAVLQTITGSPFGTNYFRIDGPTGSNLDGKGNNFIQTDQFTVQGRIFKGPIITGFAPASPVSDVQGGTRTFNITVDKVVNVTWYINGNPVQTNTTVTQASYTNISAAPGTWNVSAVAQNANGTAMQTWIWEVAATGAPAVIGSSPLSPVINVAGDTTTFSVTFDQVVDVTWYINGNPVQTNTSVPQANYTNISAAIGTWDVSAVAQNLNGTVTKNWVWEVSMPISATNGYPLWYQDANGLKLDLCLAGPDGLADPKCVLPTVPPLEPNFNPALPFVFPSNFPSESFYWYADNVMTLPGGGKALLVLGLEAAFGGVGDPVPDQQIVFGRVRIRIDAPVAGTYVVTHPYGVDTFNVATPGIRAISFTEDIGCLGGPCDFRLALKSRIKPFLTAVNPAPPAGYIGDRGILQTVTGSPFGTNVFRIQGPPGSNLGGTGIDTVESNLFTLQGRIFNGTAAAPIDVQLPTDPAGTTTAPVTAVSPSGNVAVTIPSGTTVLSATGDPLAGLTITSITSLPLTEGVALTAGQGIVGEIVGLGPAGTVFNPPIQVRFNYTDAQLAAAGITAASLQVKFFNTATGVWEPVPTTVDQAGRFVTASISHFSTFSMIGIVPTAITGAIAGNVTDATTGATIAGVTVTAGLAEATTDAEGVYRIANLAQGTYTVTASKPGFVTSTTSVTVASGATSVLDFMLQPVTATYQITLEPALPVVNSPVTATVLKNGNPESGILVQFVLNGGTPVLSTTDSQGKARFIPLIPGILDIYAGTMDGTPLVNRSVSVAPAPDTYQITLEPVVPVVNSTVTATVLKSGSPEPGILVQFVLNGGTPILSTTDSQGKARFIPHAPGTLDIYATTMNGVPLANRSVPVLDIQPVYGVDLSVNVQTQTVLPGVNATYVITVSNKGNVTDIYDLAVENKNNAKVASLSESSVLLDAGESTTVLLDVGNSGTGIFVVEVSATSLSKSSIIDSVTTTTTVSLQHLNGIIAGKVTDSSTGAAISGATVTAGSVTTTTDAAGNYIIGIASGTYTVTASANGYIPGSAAVTVAPGATTTQNFALSPVPAGNGIIAGKVTDSSTGAAISGATVTAGSVTATTDAAGSYSITIASGTYTVTVSANGYIPRSEAVTVVSGATTTRNFALSPVPAGNGIIAGKVTDSSTGAAISGATVTAGSVTATTDAAGNYVISIASGTYTVTASADDYNSASATVTVVSGATATQNFALTASEAEKPEAGEVGRGGGGSGGGGVTTSEPYENVEKAERSDKGLIANTPVIYDFIAREHGIEQIVVTGNENENDIALRVEVLKGTAKTVTAAPPGIVYKNLNIWAGTKRIKEAVIRFKVENSWMQSNDIAGSDVKMLKWDGSKWIQLETREADKDSTYTHYEATTDTFSSFTIIGMKGEAPVPAATPEVKITQPEVTPGVTTAPPEAAFPINLIVVTGVFILIAVIVLLSIRRR